MTTRKLLKIVEEIVSRDDEILVSARKVYLLIKHQHKSIKIPSFHDFVSILKRSRKFEVIEHGEFVYFDLPENIEKLLIQSEIYGAGPRIKLRSIKLTPKLLREELLKSYQKTKNGIELILSRISSENNLPFKELNEMLSSFAEFGEQINKTVQMLEKLELYELTTSVEKRKAKNSF